MPASYAHYRFGKQLLPQLPADVRQCIQRFRRLFDMGLFGPDIFFYHSFLVKTAAGSLGSKFHRQSGRDFFSAAGSAATSEAARAYLYGLLAHYCLDSLCHPYVQQVVDIDEATHVALESELERFLLVRDKVPVPHTYDPSSRMKLTRGECMTVAAFYPPATGAQINQSVKAMAFCTHFLANPNRRRTEALVRKCFPGYLDHMIPETENEELALYVLELNNLFDQALLRYPVLLAQLTAYLQKEEPLGEEFSPTFG